MAWDESSRALFRLGSQRRSTTMKFGVIGMGNQGSTILKARHSKRLREGLRNQYL